MLMKTHSLFYILLAATFCLFTSCEPNYPEEIDVQAQFLASYLTNVYSVGDSVYFTKEDGQIEGFVVAKNEIEKSSKIITAYKEEEDCEEEECEEEEWGMILRTYMALLTTQFKSSQHTITIYLNYKQEGGSGYRAGTVCYGKNTLDVWSAPWGVDADFFVDITKENYIYLSGERSTSCLLHPNIGVVSIATWYERNRAQGDVRQEWTLYKHVKQ